MQRNAFIAALTLFFAINAASYFYWSYGWGNLFGNQLTQPVGIGFPFLVWHNGVGFAVPEVRWISLATNAIIAVVSAALIAWLLPKWSSRFKLVPAQPTPVTKKRTSPAVPSEAWLRFSLTELMILTAMLAAILAVSNSVQDNLLRSALKVIYVLGPCILCWLIYMLQRLPSSTQSKIVLVAAVSLMIGAAILAENSSEIRDFTKGLMGIFVCWSPQLLFLGLLTTVSKSWRRSPG